MDERRKRARQCAAIIELTWHQFEMLLHCAVFVLMCYRERMEMRRRAALGERTFSTMQSRRDEIDRVIRTTDVDCISSVRMDMNAFAGLCELLRVKGGLKSTGSVSIEEQVLTFVHILAHHQKLRNLHVRFERSCETISRHFNNVLRAVIRLQKDLFVKPTPVSDDCTDTRWKWFKGCLGALDGTYIDVTVLDADRPRYRTRKGRISMNVLGVCDRDMKFVLVFPGWEGSASDSRVLRDAVSRRNGLQVPVGNYYLVDAGYTNGPGFLAPYRGVRYHLKEWAAGGARLPSNYEEYFNLKHSQARNIIERAFGLLKRRWAILRSPSFYPIRTQGRIIMACCILHNYIRNVMPIDPEEVSTNVVEDAEVVGEEQADAPEIIDCVRSSDQWTRERDDLARKMFEEWSNLRGNAT